MAILADTNAVYHGFGPALFREDPAEGLAGFPSTDAILQPRKINWNASSLGTTTKVYTSGTRNSIVRLAQFYANLRATVEIEEGPVYKLTVILPYDEFADLDEDPSIYAIWEIIPQAREYNIFSAGIYSPNVRNGPIIPGRRFLPTELKTAVEYANKNPSATLNLTVASGYSTYAYLAENYAALMKMKVDSVASYAQTLKRSFIINNSTPINSYDPLGINDNMEVPVLHRNTLIGSYNVPDRIAIHMLPSYKRFITDIAKDSVILAALAGYLPKAPTYQMITPNKIQFSQEFIWGEWCDALYVPYNNNYNIFPVSS